MWLCWEGTRQPLSRCFEIIYLFLAMMPLRLIHQTIMLLISHGKYRVFAQQFAVKRTQKWLTTKRSRKSSCFNELPLKSCCLIHCHCHFLIVNTAQELQYIESMTSFMRPPPPTTRRLGDMSRHVSFAPQLLRRLPWQIKQLIATLLITMLMMMSGSPLLLFHSPVQSH